MQLETPEISMVLSYASRTEGYTWFSHPESDGLHNWSMLDLNYFSAAYPFALFEKNMIVSLNYQRLYDLSKELKYNQQTFEEPAPGVESNFTEKVCYKAEGGIKAFSPAYAVQITEDISFGFTLNFWTDVMGGRNGWKEEFRSQGERTINGSLIYTSQYDYSHEYESARGFNFNLGVLWQINEIITFGAVFKGPLKLKMSHSYIKHTSGTIVEKINEDRKELNLPLSYGAGLAFRFSDAFTFAFDAYRTEWGQYFFTAEDGSRTSPLDGRPRSESHIKATNQVHVGAEYLFILEKTIIPVRGGVFYGPEPSEEDGPEDFYGVSLGSGISIGDVIIDAAYQYRWGDNADNKSIPDTEADVDQHIFYMSVIYHF
jgi:long-subunit fatty acid transport protein